MTYPQYAEINGKKYKINTDFRVAIECNEIAQDASIGDYERALAIIYKLYGAEGLNDFDNHDKLLDMAKKYLSCDKEIVEDDSNVPYMDYVEDEGYIRSSFRFDYQYDPYEKDYVHWYQYYNDLCNLSNNDFGTCCVLNRVINLRKFDTSKIKDPKERTQMEKAKRSVELKKYKKEVELTEAQRESRENIRKLLGI